MRVFCAKAIILLIVAAGWYAPDAPDARPGGQEQTAAPRLRQEITAEDAKALEEGLKTNPDNLPVREKLISYYFRANLMSRASDLEERRQKHVFWLIEHHPESELAGSPEAGIQPVGLIGSTEGYQHGKQLWLQQVETHATNLKVVRNAAAFVSLWDTKLSRELLEKALTLDPGDAQASSMLAQSYMLERLGAKSPDEKRTLAQKALSIRERGLEKASREERFYGVSDLATDALEARDLAKAEQYASELLQSAQDKNDWNYGDAIHKGHIVLGRIALQHGDLSGAKEHLLAAGETPGSPQLNSFGPNMTLAKELLERVSATRSSLTYNRAPSFGKCMEIACRAGLPPCKPEVYPTSAETFCTEHISASLD